jgi:hypothetical protein
MEGLRIVQSASGIIGCSRRKVASEHVSFECRLSGADSLYNAAASKDAQSLRFTEKLSGQRLSFILPVRLHI